MLYEIMKYWMQLQDTTQPGAFIDYRIPREVDQQIIDKRCTMFKFELDKVTQNRLIKKFDRMGTMAYSSPRCYL